MKTRTILLLIALAGCISAPAAADIVRKVFEPVAVTVSTPPTGTYTDYTSATAFGSKQYYISCLNTQVAPWAKLSGSNNLNDTPNLIVDNYIQVERHDESGGDVENYCPNIEAAGCFSGVDWSTGGPLAHVTEAASAVYLPVAPQEITTVLAADVLRLYTFRLMDWGYTYASSALWLHTNCFIIDEVCHQDKGKKQYKTLTLDASAISAHLAHGDDIGACPSPPK